MNMDKARFWRIADLVKRRLFDRLRRETQQIDYRNYKEYRERFKEIPHSLIEEWEDIKREYKDDPDADLTKLRGFLYEALFYYACLELQALFMDAEIIEMTGYKFDRSPPWFGAIPLYDIIPGLHHIWEKEKGGWKRKRKVPQVKADFLVQYADDEGPLPPALIDVKSSKPLKYGKERWGWQITSAVRRGFIFQVAYPKRGIKGYPKSLKEWKIKTPCPKCKKLSDNYRRCSECGEEIFPFTIVDAHYEAEKLWRRLGKVRRGRF